MLNRDGYKVGYTGKPKAWRGVLRDEKGAIVFMTIRTYHNRDASSSWHDGAQEVVYEILDWARRTNRKRAA